MKHGRRHDPVPALTVELAPVYRCGTGGRRYLTQRAAYWRAAVDAWIQARESAGEHTALPVDDVDDDDYGQLQIIRRLARWLRWRDGRRAAIARAK